MKLHAEITPELGEWILRQPLFFVASAPLDASGHVNLSPRGYDTLRLLSPTRVAWLDLTGSGNETAAHLQENGRITLMFCAFSGDPRILRLYGKGSVVLPSDGQWSQLVDHFDPLPGARQIVVVEVERVQTSCGYAVPLMAFEAERKRLVEWSEKKGEAGLKDYRKANNTRSIDNFDIKVDAQ